MIKDYLLSVKAGSSPSLQLFASQSIHSSRKTNRRDSKQATRKNFMDSSQNYASDVNIILSAMKDKKDSIGLDQKGK